MNQALVVVSSFKEVDLDQFDRIVSKGNGCLKAYRGDWCAHVFEQDFFENNPPRSLFCTKTYAVVEVAATLYLSDLTYLISRANVGNIPLTENFTRYGFQIYNGKLKYDGLVYDTTNTESDLEWSEFVLDLSYLYDGDRSVLDMLELVED